MDSTTPLPIDLVTPEHRAQLDQARSHGNFGSAGKGNSSQQDEAMSGIESTVAGMEQDALKAEHDFHNDPQSKRRKVEALRREMNHVRYVK